MAPQPGSAPDTLQTSLATIFDQAQTSLANHRKNCVALYKIHVKTGAASNKKSKKNAGLVDQSEFIAVFLDMVSRAIVVKKGPATVDRVIKFVAHYVRYVNEKAHEDKEKQQPEAPPHSISSGSAHEDDTLASVFVSSILEWIGQGFVAKNKVVRYQAVHLVAEMILYLGEIDEDSYLTLRENLIERSTCDKESVIRAQAVSSLAHLIGSEDPSELQDGEKSILEVILDVLAFDPAAEVRRAALLHLPLTVSTLETILTRTRDVDPLVRKLVYASVFQPRLEHPRLLSIAQREQLVQTGLGDREPAVRLAAGKMVAAWLELVLADPVRAEDAVAWTADDGGIMIGLIAFLTLFDVVGPGEAVAVDALLSLLTTRSDLFDAVVFSDDYWQHLTPESAVLARVFLEHCLSGTREDRLESAALPVVTAFAFHMQEAYNQLLAVLDDAEVARALSGEDPDAVLSDDVEEELAKREVILGELLRMAVKLDYGDEIGRRKVYSVTRDMLAHPQLPPGLIARCLDVLKEILPTERELIRVVVEIIMDLREPEEEAEANDHDTTQGDTTQSTIRRERSLRRTKLREEMSAEEAVRVDLTDIRCLEVCTSMLERVHGNFEDNSTLEGVLGDLIIPAVRRKELGIREKGLAALGLCCLLAKSIAIKSLQLFLSQIQNAPEQLKFKLLQIVFDLMVMYDQQLWSRPEDGQAVLSFLADTLEAEESPVVQAVLCVGLAKLLLSGLAEDPKILKSLLLAYVSPYTAENVELRQCLSYFFSVYSYSSAANQSQLQSIFIEAFDEVARLQDELGEKETMITPQQFGLLVVDWTDARKAAETVASSPNPQRAHADIAVDILIVLYDSDRRSEDQEVLCTLFSHLHIAAPLPPPLLVKLSVLLQHIQRQCPFDDAALDKAVSRFKSRFTTDFADTLSGVDWAEWETPEMHELYDFIGIDVPNERDARPGTPESPIPSMSRKSKLPGKAARSKSRPAPTEDSGQDYSGEDGAPPPSPSPQRTAALKASHSKSTPTQSENERETDEDKDEAPPPPSPVLMPRAAKGKGKVPAKRARSVPVRKEEIVQSTDGEDEKQPSPVPVPRAPARTGRSRSKRRQEDEPASSVEDNAPSPKQPPRTRTGRSRSKRRQEDEPASGVEGDAPSPVPAPKAKRQSKRSRSRPAPEDHESGSGDQKQPASGAVPPRRPARTARTKLAPPPKDLDPDVELTAENEAPAAVPVTPPKKARQKRVRTPGAKADLPSPADKKRRKPDREAAAPAPVKGTRSSSRRKPAPAPAEVNPDSGDDDFGGYSES